MTSKFRANVNLVEQSNVAKKPQVCNYCKTSRLRCSGGQPCDNCASKGIECTIGYIDYKLPMRINLDMKFFTPQNIKQQKKVFI
jgi:hypothetical protein